jgi:hypothetical protein
MQGSELGGAARAARLPVGGLEESVIGFGFFLCFFLYSIEMRFQEIYKLSSGK